jgi:hypothetical protein
MGLLVPCSVAALVWSLRRGDYVALVRTPCILLFAYWTAVGAWRRTSWGLVTVHAGPTLNGTHTRRMVLLAAACPVVLAFALAVQVVLGRS